MVLRRFLLRSVLRALLVAVALSVVPALAAGAPVSDGEEAAPPAVLAWRFSAGFDFSEGDYGLDRDSTLYYVPLGVTVDYGWWRTRLVVPFLVSDGPTTVLPDLAPSGSDRDATAGSDQNSGLGQIQASISYLFDPPSSALPFLEVGLDVTAPTETDDALGTGEWAFAPRLDFFQRYGWLTPFATVGRRHFTGSDLDDRFFTSVGAGIALGERGSLGVAYDWREAAVPGADDAHEIVPYASIPWGEKWTFGPYAVFGLSDGSPDYGLGFTVSVRR